MHTSLPTYVWDPSLEEANRLMLSSQKGLAGRGLSSGLADAIYCVAVCGGLSPWTQLPLGLSQWNPAGLVLTSWAGPLYRTLPGLRQHLATRRLLLLGWTSLPHPGL